MFSKRQGIIVWVYNLKNVKALRRFGNIHYVSRRMKYVVLYCSQEKADKLVNKLSTLPFVKKVELSYRPFLKLEYDKSKQDKTKEYDYHIGI